MKATGIVRKMDALGRIVIPKEIRNVYDIGNSDPIEMYTESDMIFLTKYKSISPCIITGEVSEDNIKLANGKITVSKEGLKILREEISNLSNE